MQSLPSFYIRFTRPGRFRCFGLWLIPGLVGAAPFLVRITNWDLSQLQRATMTTTTTTTKEERLEPGRRSSLACVEAERLAAGRGWQLHSVGTRVPISLWPHHPRSWRPPHGPSWLPRASVTFAFQPEGRRREEGAARPAHWRELPRAPIAAPHALGRELVRGPRSCGGVALTRPLPGPRWPAARRACGAALGCARGRACIAH